MDKFNFFGNLTKSIQKLFSFKSSTFENITLIESYNSDPFQIENVESFYKLITKISAIPKSLQEISNTILSQKFSVRDKNKTDKEIKSLPPQLQALLDNPNESYSLYELITLLILDLLISGNAIGYLTQNGKNLSLRRIDPQYFQFFRGEWWENNPYGQTIKLDSKYIIHVKFQPDPYNPRWGKGIIANNITLFTRIIRMLEFSENFYENGCHPTAVISIENGGAVDQKRIENLLTERKKGSKNTGTPLILTGKVTYEQIQLDPNALKLSEELTILYKEVMSAFGLPKFLMEVGLKDSGQKYNNHSLQMEYFLKNTIIPIANKIETFFTKITERYNPLWKFNFDINAEVYSSEELQLMLDAGTISRAEHRKYSNLPESDNENLDSYLVPSSLKTIESVIEGLDAAVDSPAASLPTPPIPPKEPPVTPPVPPTKKLERGQVRKYSWRDDHYLSEPGADIWTIGELKKDVNKKRIRQDFINLNAKTRIKKTKEANVKFTLHLIDIYGNILAAIAKHSAEIDSLSAPNKGEKKVPLKLINEIYNDGEDLGKLEKITLPLFHGVGEATYSNTENILTVAMPFNPTDPGVAAKINLLRKDGPLVTQTTKAKLTDTITAGITAGKTHTEIAKDIWLRFVDVNNDLADEFAKIYRPGVKPKDFDAVMTRGGKLQNRAVLIARTEVARANRLFASESMAQSGVVKTVTIINCEPGCPICGPHQNVEVSFADADTIGNLHPNCSGAIVPGTISVD
jgi:HK97 family phage portal protein